MSHGPQTQMRQPRRMTIRALAGIVIAGFISGCTATASSNDAASDATAKTSDAGTRLAVAPPRTPAAPGADPAQLRGMPADMLRALLGEPRLIRHEPPAEVWLYAAGSCVFHVFLYDQPDAGGYRVTHYDVVPTGRKIQPVRDCFASLLSRADHRARES